MLLIMLMIINNYDNDNGDGGDDKPAQCVFRFVLLSYAGVECSEEDGGQIELVNSAGRRVQAMLGEGESVIGQPVGGSAQQQAGEGPSWIPEPSLGRGVAPVACTPGQSPSLLCVGLVCRCYILPFILPLCFPVAPGAFSAFDYPSLLHILFSSFLFVDRWPALVPQSFCNAGLSLFPRQVDKLKCKLLPNFLVQVTVYILFPFSQVVNLAVILSFLHFLPSFLFFQHWIYNDIATDQ